MKKKSVYNPQSIMQTPLHGTQDSPCPGPCPPLWPHFLLFHLTRLRSSHKTTRRVTKYTTLLQCLGS